MTREGLEATYRMLVKISTGLIESSDKEIKWLNKRIAEQRKEDRELVEYVWSKGVVTKHDMEVFTKDFKSSEMKELLKMRDREYAWRDKQRKAVKRYSAALEGKGERA